MCECFRFDKLKTNLMKRPPGKCECLGVIFKCKERKIDNRPLHEKIYFRVKTINQKSLPKISPKIDFQFYKKYNFTDKKI